MPADLIHPTNPAQADEGRGTEEEEEQVIDSAHPQGNVGNGPQEGDLGGGKEEAGVKKWILSCG